MKIVAGKTDCFGYDSETFLCNVLKDSYCRKGRECPFYKNRDVEYSELLKYNGTMSIDKACTNYQREMEARLKENG